MDELRGFHTRKACMSDALCLLGTFGRGQMASRLLRVVWIAPVSAVSRIPHGMVDGHCVDQTVLWAHLAGGLCIGAGREMEDKELFNKFTMPLRMVHCQEFFASAFPSAD